MPPVAYEDLEGKDGTFENTPGTEQVVYYAAKEDIESGPDAPPWEDITGFEDAAVIDGDTTPYVMVQGKKFNKIKILLSSGSIDGEMVGERGSRSVQTNFTFTYIGSTKGIFGAQRVMKEGEYIFLAPHANGDVQQIGTIKDPALVTINTQSGQQGESPKGATFTVEAMDRSAWLFQGDIPLEAAV